MTRLAALLLLAQAVAPAFADAPGEAQALFDQGIADLRAQRYELACKELGASLAKHPDSGTKGALAVCYTQLGKTASAWQLWRDLADTAPTAALRSDATSKAAALAPSLARYIVTVAAPTPGLVVRVNGDAVDPGVTVPLPVDPGALTVTASAPDHDDWTDHRDAVAGQTVTVAIPALVAHPRPAPVGPTAALAPEPRADHRRLALALAGGGAAAAVVGLGFGAHARSAWHQAQSDCGATISACPGSALPQAQRDYDSASTAATVADVLVIGGGALLVGAAVAWWTSPRESAAAVRVAPTVAPGSAGLSVWGAW